MRFGDRLQRFTRTATDDSCADEAIVRGWTEAIEKAHQWGVTHVTVVVNSRLLSGYLRFGWRIRSLAMLSAMRAFADATNGVGLEFRYRLSPARACDDIKLDAFPGASSP